jgi:hypothetical protein
MIWKLKLVANWRRVAKCSSAFWINLVVGVTAAASAGIEYAADGKLGWALAVAGVNFAASVARLVKQESVSGGDDDE